MTEKQTEKQEEKERPQAPENLPDCQTALAETRREADELKDKYLRAAAQVENVRKWTRRDVLAEAKESQRGLLRQLLEVMDNLERSLDQPADPDTFYQGVQMTQRQLEKVLTQAGVRRIPVRPGEPFDPAVHEAVEIQPGDSDLPVVVSVVKDGYMVENDLLRPASVVVAR